MRFEQENPHSYRISSYERGQVTVIHPPGRAPAADEAGAPEARRETLSSSFVIAEDVLIREWPPEQFDQLREAHFAMLAEMRPEVVLFGSGARLRFPPAGCIAPLNRQGIGVEVMDTGAACRTFNILMSEGRRVAAALLMIEGTD